MVPNALWVNGPLGMACTCYWECGGSRLCGALSLRVCWGAWLWLWLWLWLVVMLVPAGGARSLLYALQAGTHSPEALSPGGHVPGLQVEALRHHRHFLPPPPRAQPCRGVRHQGTPGAASLRALPKDEMSHRLRPPQPLCGLRPHVHPIYRGSRDTFCPYCGAPLCAGPCGERVRRLRARRCGADASGLVCSASQIRSSRRL